jgi:hypothetical protein
VSGGVERSTVTVREPLVVEEISPSAIGTVPINL